MGPGWHLPWYRGGESSGSPRAAVEQEVAALREAEVGVALLFVGFSDLVGPLGPLPFDLALLGAPGCFEYTSIELMLAHPVLTGTAVQQFAVPVNPALAGMRLHAQWLVFGTAMTTTEAVHINVR